MDRKEEIILKNITLEDVILKGVSIQKMDELAAYFAIEYYINYDLKCSPDDREPVQKEKNETFYGALHRQENVADYCRVLKSFFYYMPLEKIERAYKELFKSPDKKLLDIFHQVYRSSYRTKYVEGISEEFCDEVKANVYYTKESVFQSHLYMNDQVYLAVVYEEHIDRGINRNNASVILLSEMEQYKKGSEILNSYNIPFEGFSADVKTCRSVYERIERGELFDIPMAILLDNTYIDKRDGREHKHGCTHMVVPVRVMGRANDGMILVKVHTGEKRSIDDILRELRKGI